MPLMRQVPYFLPPEPPFSKPSTLDRSSSLSFLLVELPCLFTIHCQSKCSLWKKQLDLEPLEVPPVFALFVMFCPQEKHIGERGRRHITYRISNKILPGGWIMASNLCSDHSLRTIDDPQYILQEQRFFAWLYAKTRKIKFEDSNLESKRLSLKIKVIKKANPEEPNFILLFIQNFRRTVKSNMSCLPSSDGSSWSLPQIQCAKLALPTLGKEKLN